jgi:hypothetical protein
VARAYLDQLERSNAVSTSVVADLTAALDRATAQLGDGERDRQLATRLQSLAAGLGAGDVDAVTTKRRAGLSETLRGIAARLR